MTTKIEWTNEVWNPVTGCTKVSQGCKNCYAEGQFPRAYKRTGRTFTDVATHPGRLGAPLHWRKPQRVFVNSMSDLFHEDVGYLFIDLVFAVMALCPQHTFQILTKRPTRMLDYMVDATKYLGRQSYIRKAIDDFCPGDENKSRRARLSVSGRGWTLPNVWLGVSVEDRETWLDRSEQLKKIPAAGRFISYEPALADLGEIDLTGIHWLIAGGESGPRARPAHPDWFRSARDQCAAAGVAYFFKQWGAWAPCETDVYAGERSPVILPLEGGVMERMNTDRGYTLTEAHGVQFFKAGKTVAGRLLDGREHSEYPA